MRTSVTEIHQAKGGGLIKKKDEILPFGYYAKSNKSYGENQMPYDFAHTWKINK